MLAECQVRSPGRHRDVQGALDLDGDEVEGNRGQQVHHEPTVGDRSGGREVAVMRVIAACERHTVNF